MNPQPKSRRWESKKYRDAAKDQPCKMRLEGHCNGNTETTVLAHKGGAGMALKSDDFDGCDCCSSCHDVLDGRVKTFLFPGEIDDAFNRGRMETIKDRLERKIIK